MPTLPSGLFYEQLFEVNGQRAYSESYSRDNNIFTAFLAVNWQDAQDFRREMLGHTEFDSGTPGRFVRTLPQICPYTANARCLQIEMANYGRRPKADDVTDFDDDVALAHPGIPPEKVSYFSDVEDEEWFFTHWAVYKCTFSRLPYTTKTDAELSGSSSGVEMERFVIRQMNANVRELRQADYGFCLVSDANTVIPVNSFVVTSESEIIYTWFQVPFDKVPRTRIAELRGKINSVAFDPVRAFPIETMLYVDTKNIDVPYQGADGNLYVDPQIIFRYKQNKDKDGATVGHQHVLDTSTSSATAGTWVKVKRRLVSPDKFLYETTADLKFLFAPQGAT